MNISNKRKQYKDRIGQANHFLITTLVGLDGIEKGLVVEKGGEFSTSWNPKDKRNSARRSRIFVQKSILAWTIESLEMYMSIVNKKPKLYEETNTDLVVAYSRAGQSIYEKVIQVGKVLNIDPVLVALMECLITWRNYTFHYDIENEIRDESLAILQLHKDEIKNTYCGLEIDRMKKTWETGGDFTFKEATSLIRASQEFVESIDKTLCEKLDSDRYIIESLMQHLKNKKKTKAKFLTIDSSKMNSFLHTLIINVVGVDVSEEKIELYKNSLDRKIIVKY